MKKFSNQEKQEEIAIEKFPIIDLVNEKLTVSYNGELENILEKNISIDGLKEFNDSVELLSETIVVEEMETFTNQLKITYGQYIDSVRINRDIEILESQKHIFVKVLSPNKVFEKSSYTVNSDGLYNINNLNKIPNEYLEFINEKESNSFFEAGNTIDINYSDIWSLRFNVNIEKYGTKTLLQETYKTFIKNNKDFIVGFIKGTTKVSNNNIFIDKEIIKNLA